MPKKLWTDGTHRRGDMAGADHNLIIRVLTADNPKKRNSAPWRRQEHLRDGMSIGQYRAAVEKAGESVDGAMDDLGWGLNQGFIRLEPPTNVWSVAEAKAKLSEILRLARAGEPQTIGSEEPCVVVSASQFTQFWQPEHLGKFLIESAPRGYDLELPSRSDDRGDPFAIDENGRAA